MKRNIYKRVMAVVLSAVLLVSCVVYAQPQKASATEATSQVYREVAKESFEGYIGSNKAPVLDGYLFAGWVAQKADGTAEPIEKLDDAVLNEEGVTVTAKFIPNHLATVACQIKADAYDDGVEKTELRVVSLVDSGDYQVVGFNLYKRIWKADTNSYKEIKLCEYSSDATESSPSRITKVYSGLYATVNGTKIAKYPENVFGKDAKGYYFTAARITGIPKAAYDSCIFVIKPYWVTADGTYVEGFGEYDRVSDGQNGIVNVSVNVKQAQAIAAGMLSVEYPAGLTYVGADVGRIFEEMKAEEKNGRVNCVGNVADISENAANPNDIYMNLRFKKTDALAFENGKLTFSIVSKEFANKDENDAVVTVEDIVIGEPVLQEETP